MLSSLHDEAADDFAKLLQQLFVKVVPVAGLPLANVQQKMEEVNRQVMGYLCSIGDEQSDEAVIAFGQKDVEEVVKFVIEVLPNDLPLNKEQAAGYFQSWWAQSDAQSKQLAVEVRDALHNFLLVRRCNLYSAKIQEIGAKIAETQDVQEKERINKMGKVFSDGLARMISYVMQRLIQATQRFDVEEKSPERLMQIMRDKL